MRVCLLSNGRYSVMLTDAGSGFSQWRDVAITRWREDPTCDPWGSYILLRDSASGDVWSTTERPYRSRGEERTGTLHADRADFHCRSGELHSTLSIAVAADLDAELRCVRLVNRSGIAHEIELTSYSELILGSAVADAAHPAFSKMFVQTEWLDENGGLLLAKRRARASDEPNAWAAHFVSSDAPGFVQLGYESDRARFLGRGRTLHNAAAMDTSAPLSDTSGCVLDPIFSLRCRVHLDAGAEVTVAFWSAVADSRESLLKQCDALRSAGACDRVFASAAAQVEAQDARFGIDASARAHAAELLAPLLISDRKWRASGEALARGHGGAPALWGKSISGDRPIIVLRIADQTAIACARDLLRVQASWRARQLGADVVLLDAAGEGGDALHNALSELAQAQNDAFKRDTSGAAASVFVLRDQGLDASLRDGLLTSARIVLDATPGGWVAASASASASAVTQIPAGCRADRALECAPETGQGDATSPREFDNGFGAFTRDGREYAIDLAAATCTPAPWINVIANESFGFFVSAEGGGYTWSLNSQQNALTPWPNDPVSDTPHEVLYLRDLDGDEIWSATALPIRVDSARYAAHHGKGYSRFTNDAFGIDLTLTAFVPARDSIKLSRLRLRNRSGRVRRIAIAGYVEWALGANGTRSAPFVVTSVDEATGALFAQNQWRAEFGERVSFIDLDGRQSSVCGDRSVFLGDGGTLENPRVLRGDVQLPGNVGAGFDPCGALRTQVELAPDAEIELVLMLGDAASANDAQALVKKYRAADLDAVFAEAVAVWDDLQQAVQVQTPDRAIDLLLNDWLLYQTLGCRLWARTAYYQASGAYGFRDQLQDVMALCVSRPDLAREHIVRAAARQFVEGDVQHWWLPPSGQGIRTRMSDDRIWLAYVVAHYIEVSGDQAILEESVPFLEGPPLNDGQDDAFFQPQVAAQAGTLYEHCARALDASLGTGVHGLPLIGTGDWNDGMNRVGEKGRGESIWLAWFLLGTIDAFTPAAQARDDQTRIARWHECTSRVKAALEDAGWDGAWYRRGYYDDATPLGSSTNLECRIDAIAQSWSVMSGSAEPERARHAMAAVDQRLICRDAKVALLFTPPFDRTARDPGYIKGYPPGVRENGGQYTHGAIWSIFAFSMLGQGDKAGELFQILNPIHHAGSAAAIARYKVEPYVSCADVYSVEPLVGRGGWTWYSGSAGWLYRAGVEAILGLRKRAGVLQIDPCIPAAWSGYSMTYRHRGADESMTPYLIKIENPQHVCRGIAESTIDGAKLAKPGLVPLSDDGRERHVRIVLG